MPPRPWSCSPRSCSRQRCSRTTSHSPTSSSTATSRPRCRSSRPASTAGRKARSSTGRWCSVCWAARRWSTSASLGARLAAYATGIMAAIVSFFLFVLVLVASPFDVLPITPADGLGLNPVLRDSGMLIHPPVVLAGFASFAVPFSFAAAAASRQPHRRRLDRAHAALRAARVELPDHRAGARHVVGVPRARLGRLLGLGSGRERRADAVARDHRVPAFGAGAGAARPPARVELRRSSSSRSCSSCSAPSSCAAGSCLRCTRSRSARSGRGSWDSSPRAWCSPECCWRGAPAACAAPASRRRRFRARVRSRCRTCS